MPQARGCSSLGKSAVLLGPQLTALPSSDGPTELRTREAWARPLRSRRGPEATTRGRPAAVERLQRWLHHRFSCRAVQHAGDRRAAGAGGLLQRRRGGGARRAPALHPRGHAAPARLRRDAARAAEIARGGGRGLSTDAAPEAAGALVGRVGHQPALEAARAALRRPGTRHAPRGLRDARPLPRAAVPRGPAPRARGAPPRSGCGGHDGRECALVVSPVGDAQRNRASEKPAGKPDRRATPAPIPTPYQLDPTPILTRWEMHGVLGNSVRNQCVLLGYMCGVPLPRIAEWYYGTHGKKNY